MTEPRKPTNPLMRGNVTKFRPAFVEVNGEQVPTDIHDYCGWLNDKERRRGIWRVVKDEHDVKSIQWAEEVATDGWLRENGLAPTIGRRA